MTAIERAEARLVAFDTDCDCIACEEPCVSCQNALNRYEDVLRGYIGAVKALEKAKKVIYERLGPDSPGASDVLDDALEAIADFERLFPETPASAD